MGCFCSVERLLLLVLLIVPHESRVTSRTTVHVRNLTFCSTTSIVNSALVVAEITNTVTVRRIQSSRNPAAAAAAAAAAVAD